MGIEIERKFLVTGDQWKEQVVSKAVLRQGYLARVENTTIRIRIDEKRAIINIKGKSAGISRIEHEYEIPMEDGEEIIEKIAVKPIIEKIRYKVAHGGHVWDLDVFEGKNEGLIVAEVELQSEQESFKLPEWAGNEVSHDPRYRNASLVSYPYHLWKDSV